MPEQLTKHPEVTLQVLRSAGARCAEGARQEILTQCPAQRFCKLPAGELCVFGLSEASHMTQITAAEWKALVQTLTAESTRSAAFDVTAVVFSGVGGLLAGAVIAVVASRLRRRRR